ncbi:MAG TPA: nickel pincer cofactor biosynthesis protein LarB [Fibrobacteria bacterium]|nr:nickel pincer cofactor biosynthesis protein LarB [Fibrobacteria bacterium]
MIPDSHKLPRLPAPSAREDGRRARLLTRLRAALKPPGAEEDLGFARVDHGREARKGFPEVVFGEGKTREQIAEISVRILARSGRLLVTRVPEEVYGFLRSRIPGLRYHAAARAAFHEGAPQLRSARALRAGHVLVVCAGTSDIPVAEEAALTARMLGCRVRVLHDVGVAGLHRLLSKLPALRRASVIIAVAGMEGALPSVVAGLVDKPVIGVPTSIGYGASMKGLAALLAILNSCASGLTVVNIDNGFGAGFAAAQMLRLAQGASARKGSGALRRAGKSPRKR